MNAVSATSAGFSGPNQIWVQRTRMVEATPDAIEQLRRVALLASDALIPGATGSALIENAIGALVQSRRRHAVNLGRPGFSPHALCDTTLSLLGEMGLDRLAAMPISARSQRSFFKKCFGLGPVQYLHLRQLHDIHKALQDKRGSLGSIAETFDRHGYAYSSYTLARYYAIFGELPSATREAAENALECA